MLSERIRARRLPRPVVWRASFVALLSLTIGDAVIGHSEDGATLGRPVAATADLLAPRIAVSRPVATEWTGAADTRTASSVRRTASLQTFPPATAAVPSVASFTPQRLLEQAAQRLSDAETALHRKASYSARASATESLRLVAEAKDYALGNRQAAQHLDAALAAIDEAGDFLGRYGTASPEVIRRLIEAHATETLKDTDPQQLNGAAAADRYLDSARHHFAALAAESPVATRALVVLATVYRQDGECEPHADAIAVNLLRAAIQASPHDAAVANELGYLLMKQGVLQESQWALERSMAIVPTREAGQNLAEVMRQRGDLEGAAALLARLHQSPQIQRGFVAAPTVPAVQQVSPEQFVTFSRPQQAFTPAQPALTPAGASRRTAIPQAVAPQTSSPERAARPGAVHSGGPSSMEGSSEPQPAAGPIGRVARAVSGWLQ